MQRFFDIALSVSALTVLSPVLIISALILRCTGEKKIFYKQERIGFCGKKIKILKFATMLENSPNIGAGTITVKNDPRVLPVGKYLRKTKINELPQLISILNGDMSLIGPRPMTEANFDKYSEEVKSHIITVRPGLSGVGSIIFRDEESLLTDAFGEEHFYRDIIAPYKGQLEIWYVRKKTIFMYFCLIFITIYVVFFPRSKLFWSVFRDAPRPHGVLRQHLI